MFTSVDLILLTIWASVTLLLYVGYRWQSSEAATTPATHDVSRGRETEPPTPEFRNLDAESATRFRQLKMTWVEECMLWMIR